MMAIPTTKNLSTTQILTVRANEMATNRVWLPRIIYESLPFIYVTTGFAAFFATLYVPEWYWVIPYYFLFACASIHTGLFIWTKRFLARRRRVNSTGNSRDTQT